MLKYGGPRSQVLQIQGSTVSVSDLHNHVRPLVKGTPRGAAPVLRYSTKTLHTIECNSALTCLDWVDSVDKFVVGHQDGAASIYDASTTKDVLRIPARQQRGCTSVRSGQANLLAIGHEKVRNDFSLTIFDLEKASTVGLFANSEAVTSSCWAVNDPHCILVGLNYRSIKLLDTRMDARDNAASMSIPTVAVYEITMDAGSNNFASTCDNNIMIWDQRNSQAPYLLLKSNAKSYSCRVNQLRFDPVGSNRLAALSDDGTLDLWQLSDQFDGDQSLLSSVQQHDTSKSLCLAYQSLIFSRTVIGQEGL